MDSNFDGFICRQDLKTFLIKVLKIDPKKINDTKIDRLFKLMDTFKRGSIKIEDIKKLIE